MTAFNEWSMSGPEEGDDIDQSVFIIDSRGIELVSIDDMVGATEDKKEFGRQVAEAMNTAQIQSPYKEE